MTVHEVTSVAAAFLERFFIQMDKPPMPREERRISMGCYETEACKLTRY